MTASSLGGVAGRFAAVAAAAAIVAFFWARAALTLRDATPVRVATRPTAVVWGDRVFTRGAPLASWLHARGESYGSWARKHPGGARLLARNGR